ncbi:hypothetical protein RCL_jg6963.t1 [Rhizophagus clarus]|uniref:Uncharacterized protein n=1 Tax=Rhizophagus clarus TaxID=94130 RepID=A0A8H3LDG0_9GLOM|nr:hypothetical protein RCL_jg6963.t1 [Rhizophagus clarus]
MKYILNCVKFGNDPYKANFTIKINPESNINLLKQVIGDRFGIVEANEIKLVKVDLPIERIFLSMVRNLETPKSRHPKSRQ